MKSDLDRLMEARQINALLITPTENEDPYRAYLSNGAAFSGMVIKKRGEPPVLIARAAEQDEAAKSGLKTYTDDDFGYNELMREHGGDLDRVREEWYAHIFERLAIRGRISLYGVADVNAAYNVIVSLTRKLGDRIEIVPDEVRNSLFDQAYETKDAGELARLRDVARRTSAIMCDTREWVASHRAGNNIVIKADGSPLTIGDVKRTVRRWLFEANLEDPDGLIFAQGRDAGVPHSKGEDDDLVRLGQPIIFDFFPREPRGYYHDVTRTWCIGYAAPEVQAVYDAVMEAYRRGAAMCKPGASTNAIQRAVCAYFEGLGHPSVLNSPSTTTGYTHGLGHGLGLRVHESPFFQTFSDIHQLKPGNVFTIEPGLYDPGREYGVRIENTVYLNEAGELETLTDCPYDLVIELKG